MNPTTKRKKSTKQIHFFFDLKNKAEENVFQNQNQVNPVPTYVGGHHTECLEYNPRSLASRWTYGRTGFFIGVEA